MFSENPSVDPKYLTENTSRDKKEKKSYFSHISFIATRLNHKLIMKWLSLQRNYWMIMLLF